MVFYLDNQNYSIDNINDLENIDPSNIMFKYIYKNNIKSFFNIKENSGGGDCLFKSFSDFIFGNATHHAEIRQNLCTYYANFKDKHKTAFEKKLKGQIGIEDVYVVNGQTIREKHSETVCNLGNWGDELDITIFAFLFQCNIYVFDGGQNPNVYQTMYYNIDIKNPVTYYLEYSGNNHYKAMIPAITIPNVRSLEKRNKKLAKEKVSRRAKNDLTSKSITRRQIAMIDRRHKKKKMNELKLKLNKEHNDYIFALNVDDEYRRKQIRDDEMYAKGLVGGKNKKKYTKKCRYRH